MIATTLLMSNLWRCNAVIPTVLDAAPMSRVGEGQYSVPPTQLSFASQNEDAGGKCLV